MGRRTNANNSMMQEASLANLSTSSGRSKKRSKTRNIAIASTKEVQWQGIFMLLVWAVVVACLIFFADTEASRKVFTKFSHLRSFYGATSVAFAFATGLDILAYTNAVSDEKRVLSGILAYVDGVACISYLAMAALPLYFLVDSSQGNPVWLMRYAEWIITCPTILYWCGLASRADRSSVSDIATADALLLAGGCLSSILPSWPAFFVFAGACATYIYVMVHMWGMYGKAMQPDFQPPPPLPRHALHLMRMEIVISWTIFPLVEGLRRQGMIDYQVGEALNCIADYAAKVGLAMIMVNCNLEQINALRVQQMHSALTGMLKVMRKTNMSTSRMAQVQGVDDDVRAWIMNEFSGPNADGSGGGSSSNGRSKKGRDRQAHSTAMDAEAITASNLFLWEFDALDKSDEDLTAVCVRIFQEMHVIEQFDIDEKKLRKWLQKVRAQYNKNPFHNFRHAVTVLHTTYLMLTTVATDFITEVELLAMLIAALCHDLDHNGLTNAFHVNSRSELALVYNDKSVLENHHAHITFEILLEKSCNIVENLEETEFKRLREIIINCILNTDMATHHTQLAKLEEINRLGGFSGLAENADQRLFVLSVLLHTSDLYTSIKPFDTAKRWAQRLQKEYNNQVCARSKGVEVGGGAAQWTHVCACVLGVWGGVPLLSHTLSHSHCFFLLHLSFLPNLMTG